MKLTEEHEDERNIYVIKSTIANLRIDEKPSNKTNAVLK